ncbi:MAG: dCTP deaminase domain-containing protein [Fusobacteriaceae bacterium]
MFLRNGILSDKQFVKHFGKDIYIYPFDNNNLKGASYNLTASPVAYYEEDGQYISSLITKNKIMLKPNKITFIQTNESIYVTQRISGTYHAKVKWATKGLSAISTTLDPCYFGTSLITIINLSNKEVEIDIGESICTIIFHKMTSGSKDLHDNTSFRKDIISGRIYKFNNVLEIKSLKNKLELEEIEENQKLDLKCKECLLVKNYDCQHEKNCNNLRAFELRGKLRKEQLLSKDLEYKNYLEAWYEKDFRSQKLSLVRKVKDSLRVDVSTKIKKI